MRAGELKDRIIIQQKTVTRNGEGMVIEKWAGVATVWAAVNDLRGRELFEAQAVNAEVTVLIKMRYRTGITSAMRVVFGQRIFDIKALPLNPDGRRIEIHLMCRELM